MCIIDITLLSNLCQVLLEERGEDRLGLTLVSDQDMYPSKSIVYHRLRTDAAICGNLPEKESIHVLRRV